MHNVQFKHEHKTVKLAIHIWIVSGFKSQNYQKPVRIRTMYGSYIYVLLIIHYALIMYEKIIVNIASE